MLSIKNYFKKIGFFIALLFLGYLINPLNLSFAFGYLIVIAFVLKKTFLLQSLDFNFFLLLLFSVFYAVFYSFDPLGGNQYIFIYATAPPFFYLLGKYLSKDFISSKSIFNFLIVIGFLFSFSYLISVLVVFLERGFSQLDRSLPYFWTGELVSATKMGAYFGLNMCIPSLLIADQGKSKLSYRIFAIVVFVLSLVCVLRLGSRTQLGIMLITTIISLIYIIPRQSLKNNIVLTTIFTLLLYIIYKNVSFDLDADWLSTFAGRMDKGADDIASGGGRTERWAKSFEIMFEKPLGWGLNEFGFAHNLWLDVLRVSGLIPFVILIIFSFRSFLNSIKMIGSKPLGINLRLLLLVYSLSFFMIFMVEPILDGLFPLFTLWCLFSGILIHIIKLEKQITTQIIKGAKKVS